MIENIVISAIMCLLLLVAAYKMIPADKRKNTYIILALVGVLLRIATVMYLYINGVDSVGTDGLLYHKVGIWISSQLDKGISLFEVRYAYTWYTVIIGVVYYVFGTNRYIISYINIIITFFSAILLFKIALAQKNKFTNASFISLAFLFFPNLILWTADSRKEALIIFICILCWYCIRKFIARGESLESAASMISAVPVKVGNSLEAESVMSAKTAVSSKVENSLEAKVPLHSQKSSVQKTILSLWICIVLVCILMWFGTLLRIYLFVPIAVGTLISLLFEYKKRNLKIYIAFGLAIIISSFLIFFFTANPLLENYHAIMFPDEIGDFGIDIANKVETVRLLASSRNILASAANYFLLPYPGNTGITEISGSTILNVIVSIDVVCWYVCMLLIATGIFSSIKKQESILLGILAFLLCYIFINILVVENVPDTIYRYRSVIVGPAFLFIDWSVIGRLKARICSVFKGNVNSKDISLSKH
jgi:hypothetical protein